MGLLNTYFYAADDAHAAELAAVLGGPSGYDSGGFTGLELDTLLAILTDVPYGTIAAEPVRFVGEPGEQWLFLVRPELVAALAGLDGASIDPVVLAWSQTDELALAAWDPADLADLLGELAALASSAGDGRRLYFWGSL